MTMAFAIGSNMASAMFRQCITMKESKEGAIGPREFERLQVWQCARNGRRGVRLAKSASYV